MADISSRLDTQALDTYPGEDSGPALKVFGWVILLSGAFGGVWVLRSLGSVEIPSYIPGMPAERVANPMGVAVGLGMIAQSVVSALMCFALAATAENTGILRREAFYARQQRNIGRATPDGSASTSADGS